MDRIYQENPSFWPHGLTAEHFDGGLYLIREKQANTPVGFCGFQRRFEFENHRSFVTGYYSIGVLPEYRNNGFAKEAVSKLLSMKSATVDRMKAMIVSSNQPSLRLADALGVEKVVKQASKLSLDPNLILEHPGQLLQRHPEAINPEDTGQPDSLLGKKLKLTESILRLVGILPSDQH